MEPAASYQAWLRKIRSTLCFMTECTDRMANYRLPSPHLSHTLPTLRKHNHDVRCLCEAVPFSEAMQAYPTMQSEHTLLMTDVTSLLVSLVVQLNRFDARGHSAAAGSIGSAENSVFFQLWGFLTAGCVAFDSAQQIMYRLLPTSALSFPTPLLEVFHSILTWILRVSKSRAWWIFTGQYSQLRNNADLVYILMTFARCLAAISAAPADILSHYLDLLSPNFFHLMYRIAWEQLGNLPPDPSPVAPGLVGAHTATIRQIRYSKRRAIFSRFCYLLTFSIGNLLDADQLRSKGQHIQSLCDPCLMQMLKAVVILEANHHDSKDAIHFRIRCLASLLGRPPPCLEFNPVLNRRALETDVWTLAALSKHLMADITLTETVCRAQADILAAWLTMASSHPTSARTMRVMTQSVIGIAKQCSMQGTDILFQMQTTCQERRRQAKEEQMQQPQHGLTNSDTPKTDTEVGMPNTHDITCVRQLMVFASEFLLLGQAADIRPKSGG